MDSCLLLLHLFIVFSRYVLGAYPHHGGFSSNTDIITFNNPNASCPHFSSDHATTQNQKKEENLLNLRLTHREFDDKDSVLRSAARDVQRIRTLQTRVVGEKHGPEEEEARRRELVQEDDPEGGGEGVLSGQLMATLESGASMGSGEYFMDVFIGTPPLHFSMILDTGSDLNWIQCSPCNICFDQKGPYYDPSLSSSFRNITCNDPRCSMVSSPRPCRGDNQTCPYFYWYGDSSNTTGDFALETFTVNLTGVDKDNKSYAFSVKEVMFGCGHWNRGLFHGAAGLLGLGRGPLSFSSQLQSLYGHSFSYCLVKRNSRAGTTSRLVFGEDRHILNHPNMNFTSFAPSSEGETFYYLQIKSVMVGGEVLGIEESTWSTTKSGGGGAIVDSGTTLSYFPEPAMGEIKEAFVRKTKGYGYPLLEGFPVLHPCYNVTGVVNPEFPSFEIRFRDGGVWGFPSENYFIEIVEGEISCLAMLRTPHSGLSIIGNYQQQNFEVVYDTKRARLGYSVADCAMALAD